MSRKLLLIHIIIPILLFGICGGVYYFRNVQTKHAAISPLGVVMEKPLDVYSIDRLSARTFSPSDIVFDTAIATTSAYTKYIFHYLVHDRVGDMGKKVTGVAHVPNNTDTEKFPVIVQFRGFVDKSIYAPGVGTNPSAAAFATAGFLTLAPDFLGYGGSDNPSMDAFEERFETYTAALTLIASLSTIPYVDTQNIFIWGHSNGGHIAITVGTVLGERGYPTSLWAPVTKPFPYSILYFTDEFDDLGKSLRKNLAVFEQDYDVDVYSNTNYLDRIAVPFQLHQGTEDEAVPVRWSNEFVALMQKNGNAIRYYTYPGSNHNVSPAWDTVVARDITFFRSLLR